MRSIIALARLILLDGLRRHALAGLTLLALAAEAGGLFFMDFFGRDIGRVSSDYLFSVIGLIGLIFLFFHAVQVIAWDEERGVIYALLSRPLSRQQYVLGVFLGLTALLAGLDLLLGGAALATLAWIRHIVDTVYFPEFSLAHFLLTWAGLFASQLLLLAAIMLFSGLVRGGFPVLLLSTAFYAICSGLPVVRTSIEQSGNVSATLKGLLALLAALFPDLGRLDFKDFVTSATTPSPAPWIAFAVALAYIAVAVAVASRLYARRDIQ